MVEMISCFIVEDEPIAQDILSTYCSRLGELSLLGIGSAITQSVKAINRLKPQLLFLDMHVSGGFGFDLIDALTSPKPLVVITTGYRNYALESYAYEVVDFLVKPISLEDFTQSVDRATRRIRSTPVTDTLEMLELKATKSSIIIPLRDILFLEANENYVQIVTQTQSNMYRSTLKEMIQKLPLNKFIQISRSHIIAVAKILKIQRDTVFLYGGYQLSISRNFQQTVGSRWNELKDL